MVVLTPYNCFPTDDNKTLIRQLPFKSTLGYHKHKFKEQAL